MEDDLYEGNAKWTFRYRYQVVALLYKLTMESKCVQGHGRLTRLCHIAKRHFTNEPRYVDLQPNRPLLRVVGLGCTSWSLIKQKWGASMDTVSMATWHVPVFCQAMHVSTHAETCCRLYAIVTSRFPSRPDRQTEQKGPINITKHLVVAHDCTSSQPLSNMITAKLITVTWILFTLCMPDADLIRRQ